MPVIIGEQKQGFQIVRKILCPGHYLIPPQVDVYLRKPLEMFKNCSDFVELKGKRYTIKKTRIVRDMFGNKQIDWKKLYELRKQGVIKEQWVTAKWAIEHVYDPLGALCLQCDKRCMEGSGQRILTRTIRRLIGKPMER